MITVRSCVAVMVALVLGTGAQAAVVQYSAILQQAQEVPVPIPVPGAGGWVSLQFDDATNVLSWDMEWFGLSGAATGSHIHGPAAPGVAAGILFHIGGGPASTLGSPLIGSTPALTPTQISQLTGGEWYINVHTALNAPGEIRGQIGLAGSSQNSPFLPGQQLPGQRGWVFNNAAGNGAWFDPPASKGLLYYTDGLSNFDSIILPVGIPDDNNAYLITDVNGSTVVAAGATHNFSPNVNSFTITNIVPGIDSSNPVAFPVFLVFDQPTVTFTMEAIPEPASLALMAAGAMILGVRRRR